MSGVLVAFARTGNINTTAVKWPKYDPRNLQCMDFGDRIEAVPVDKGIYFFIANPDIRIELGAGGRGGPGAPGRGRGEP